jgi:hypothetical protein
MEKRHGRLAAKLIRWQGSCRFGDFIPFSRDLAGAKIGSCSTRTRARGGRRRADLQGPPDREPERETAGAALLRRLDRGHFGPRRIGRSERADLRKALRPAGCGGS